MKDPMWQFGRPRPQVVDMPRGPRVVPSVERAPEPPAGDEDHAVDGDDRVLRWGRAS